jgi:SAM-dependent methyltransferase
VSHPVSLSCPVCYHPDPALWLEVGAHRYLECQGCSLVSLPTVEIKEPRGIYTRDYFESGAHSGYTNYLADEALHRLNGRRHLRRLARAGAHPPGVLLDLGCAAGFFMSEAARMGWQVYGVDISPWARHQVRKRFGFTAFESVDEASEHLRGKCDVATALQVLEHMPEPASTLRSLSAVLRPTGHLLIETWNRASLTARITGSRWQQLSPPSVIHVFDAASLNHLLIQAGFRPVRLRRMVKFLSAAWAAGLVASKLKSDTLRRLATVGLLRRIPVPYPLDDLVTVTTQPAAA